MKDKYKLTIQYDFEAPSLTDAIKLGEDVKKLINERASSWFVQVKKNPETEGERTVLQDYKPKKGVAEE